MTNSFNTDEREGQLTPEQQIRLALEMARKVCHGRFCDPHPMGQAEVCKAVTEAITLLDSEAAGGAPCLNCWHTEPHNGPAGMVDDACSHGDCKRFVARTSVTGEWE